MPPIIVNALLDYSFYRNFNYSFDRNLDLKITKISEKNFMIIQFENFSKFRQIKLHFNINVIQWKNIKLKTELVVATSAPSTLLKTWTPSLSMPSKSWKHIRKLLPNKLIFSTRWSIPISSNSYSFSKTNTNPNSCFNIPE